MAAPVAQTCPDIDKALRKISAILDEIRWIEKDYPDLKREMGKIEDCCGDIEDAFENLRKDNEILRAWGTEMEASAQAVEQLEEQLDDVWIMAKALEEMNKELREELMQYKQNDDE